MILSVAPTPSAAEKLSALVAEAQYETDLQARRILSTINLLKLYLQSRIEESVNV